MKFTIVTNVADLLSVEISNPILPDVEIELRMLKEKGENRDSLNKFIFIQIPIKNLIDNIENWSKLRDTVEFIFDLSLEKSKRKGIQIWFSDSDPASLNIAFAISEREQIVPLLISLREFLLSRKEELKKIDDKKVLWVGYSLESQTWQMQIFK